MAAKLLASCPRLLRFNLSFDDYAEDDWLEDDSLDWYQQSGSSMLKWNASADGNDGVSPQKRESALRFDHLTRALVTCALVQLDLDVLDLGQATSVLLNSIRTALPEFKSLQDLRLSGEEHATVDCWREWNFEHTQLRRLEIVECTHLDLLSLRQMLGSSRHTLIQLSLFRLDLDGTAGPSATSIDDASLPDSPRALQRLRLETVMGSGDLLDVLRHSLMSKLLLIKAHPEQPNVDDLLRFICQHPSLKSIEDSTKRAGGIASLEVLETVCKVAGVDYVRIPAK